jgi:serine/threonine protein kinase
LSGKPQFKVGSIPCGNLLNGRYEYLAELGEGGFATVYKAQDIELGREVAIKIIKTMEADSAEDVMRFRREARSLAQLQHDNIITVYSIELVAEKFPAIIMEYLEGSELQSIIKTKGTLKYEQFKKIFTQVCSALAYAHEINIAHRDLSTLNIFLLNADAGMESKVKIIDFGLAKLMDRGDSQSASTSITRTGVVVGTPAYMSPEQCRGDNIDFRSDMYSLGCIMYECLTGRPPLEDPDPIQLLIRQQSEMPAPPQFSWGNKQKEDLVKNIILKCLQKDRNNRFQSCQEIIEILNESENVEASQFDKIAGWKGAERKRKNRIILPLLGLAASLTLFVLAESDIFLQSAASMLSSNAPSFMSGYRAYLANKLKRKRPEIAITIYEDLAAKRPASQETVGYLQSLANIYLQRWDLNKTTELYKKIQKCQQAGFHAETGKLTADFKILELNSAKKRPSEQEILTRAELLRTVVNESDRTSRNTEAMVLALIHRTRVLADFYYLEMKKMPDQFLEEIYSVMVPAFKQVRIKTDSDDILHLPQPQNKKLVCAFDRAVLERSTLRPVDREQLVTSLSATLLADKKAQEAYECLQDYLKELNADQQGSAIAVYTPLAQTELHLGRVAEAREAMSKCVDYYEKEIRDSTSLERYRSTLTHYLVNCWQLLLLEKNLNNRSNVRRLCLRIENILPNSDELASRIPMTAHDVGVNNETLRVGAPDSLPLGSSVEFLDSLHQTLYNFEDYKQEDLFLKMLKYYCNLCHNTADLSNPYRGANKMMERRRWNDTCQVFTLWCKSHLESPEIGAEEKSLLKECYQLRSRSRKAPIE